MFSVYSICFIIGLILRKMKIEKLRSILLCLLIVFMGMYGRIEMFIFF